MSVSSLSRKIRWKLTIPGLLLVLAALWIYPTAFVLGWSNAQWSRSLIGTTWTFSRYNGPVISDTLQLAPFGRIRGYAHPNEARWAVHGKALEFIRLDGVVTSHFALGAGVPLVGLTLASNGPFPHQLKMSEDRHQRVFWIDAACAMLGSFLLGASIWLREGIATGVWRQGRERLAICEDDIARTRRRMPFVKGKHVAFTLLGAWFLFACLNAARPAYVPDEAWFLYEALLSGKAVHEGEAVHQLLFHQNAFGYGGIWWSLYTCITLAWDGLMDIYAMPAARAMFDAGPGVGKVQLWEFASPALFAPIIMIRVVSLAAFAWFGVMLARSARSGSAALLTILILVSLPMAWWSGKLGSPELFGAALFAIAVLHWSNGRHVLPALLLATVAVSIKLTIAPVYIVLVGFVAWDLWHQPGGTWRRLVGYGLCCLAVMLLCNTWLLFDAKSGFQQLVDLSRAFTPDPDVRAQRDRVLWAHPNMWEGTNYGSLAYWAGGASTLFAALAIAFSRDRRLGCFLLIGGIAQYIFMMSQPPHAWYWFPVILSALIPFARLKSKGAIRAGIFLLATLYPFEYARQEIAYKAMHVQELTEVTIQRECVQEKLSQSKPDDVYDMAAVGTFMSHHGKPDWRAHDFHGSYVNLIGADAPAPGLRQFLVLGARSDFFYGVLRDRYKDRTKLIATCGTIKLINLSR